jgi:hypothetical protein
MVYLPSAESILVCWITFASSTLVQHYWKQHDTKMERLPDSLSAENASAGLHEFFLGGPEPAVAEKEIGTCL